MQENEKNAWWIYKGTGIPHDDIDERLPEPPSWRRFRADRDDDPVAHIPMRDTTAQLERGFGKDLRGAKFQANDEEKDLINAALYLRRPLFVTGKPGCGKSLLPYAIAHELNLGPVLRWSITTRVTLQDGLYHYDALGRLQDASLASKKRENAPPPPIGDYIRLGPLGTALLPTKRPRVLLIDEIDKSDIDLPNDLLNIFEEGEYYIPELVRDAKQQERIILRDTYGHSFTNVDSSEVSAQSSGAGSSEFLWPEPVKVMPHDGQEESDKVYIEGGRVSCHAFPFVVLTSNEEREFPPAFLRRCIRLKMQPPEDEKLRRIVEAHLGKDILENVEQLIRDFIERGKHGDLATDQLLNAVYLVTRDQVKLNNQEQVLATLWEYLARSGSIESL